MNLVNDPAPSRRVHTGLLGCRMVAEHCRAERDSHKLDPAPPDGRPLERYESPAGS
jgi:glyoxylase I family protein